MIRINLLKDLNVKSKKKKLPVKRILAAAGILIVLGIAVMAGLSMLNREEAAPEEETALIRLPKKILPKLHKVETPFDVVEDIVDDIHGGRFRVNGLTRLGSPSHLSPNEKKLFERLFVRNTFLAFNSAIKAGMGFNTITLDAEGSFFVFGVTQDEASAMAFQKDISGSNMIASAEELSFESKFGESRHHFALKGFLNFSFVETAYEDDTWTLDEQYKSTGEQVLFDVMRIGESQGIRFKSKPENIKEEPFLSVKRRLMRMQIESTYPGLMRWITDVAESGVQMGFTKINLTSVGKGRILAVAEVWLYSQN
ncbi:MAG: hypothetical protein JNL74_13510 [Fibrobacteres bacterium]|nr:hypothetical protein [Fibrobacterota bacterium]